MQFHAAWKFALSKNRVFSSHTHNTRVYCFLDRSGRFVLVLCCTIPKSFDPREYKAEARHYIVSPFLRIATCRLFQTTTARSTPTVTWWRLRRTRSASSSTNTRAASEATTASAAATGRFGGWPRASRSVCAHTMHKQTLQRRKRGN